MAKKEPVCKHCGAIGSHYSTFCVKAPKKPLKRVGRPRQQGKEYERWRKFRDEVAIPYLDKNFGRKCRCCGVGGQLDVDHIKPKGSHPQLKYQLSNLNYLCRPCHRLKTDNIPCTHVLQ